MEDINFKSAASLTAPLSSYTTSSPYLPTDRHPSPIPNLKPRETVGDEVLNLNIQLQDPNNAQTERLGSLGERMGDAWSGIPEVLNTPSPLTTREYLEDNIYIGRENTSANINTKKRPGGRPQYARKNIYTGIYTTSTITSTNKPRPPPRHSRNASVIQFLQTLETPVTHTHTNTNTNTKLSQAPKIWHRNQNRQERVYSSLRRYLTEQSRSHSRSESRGQSRGEILNIIHKERECRQRCKRFEKAQNAHNIYKSNVHRSVSPTVVRQQLLSDIKHDYATHMDKSDISFIPDNLEGKDSYDNHRIFMSSLGVLGPLQTDLDLNYELARKTGGGGDSQGNDADILLEGDLSHTGRGDGVEGLQDIHIYNDMEKALVNNIFDIFQNMVLPIYIYILDGITRRI